MTIDHFKPFTSYGDKLVPALASDWKVHPSDRKNHIQLVSNSISQMIDMHIDTFFRFLDTKEITMKGKKIEASLAINARGNFETEDVFFEWQDLMETLKSNEVKKKDLLIGESYILDDSEDVIFLGTKYVSRIKDKTAKLTNITKITKKYFFYSLKFDVIKELKKETITPGNNRRLTSDKAEEKLNEYYHSDVSLCYFKDYNSKDVTYEFIPVEKVVRDILLFKFKGTDTLFSSYRYFTKSSFEKPPVSQWYTSDKASFHTIDGKYKSFKYDDFSYNDIAPYRIGVKETFIEGK